VDGAHRMRYVTDSHSLRIRHLDNAMTYSLANDSIDNAHSLRIPDTLQLYKKVAIYCRVGIKNYEKIKLNYSIYLIAIGINICHNVYEEYICILQYYKFTSRVYSEN